MIREVMNDFVSSRELFWIVSAMQPFVESINFRNK